MHLSACCRGRQAHTCSASSSVRDHSMSVCSLRSTIIATSLLLLSSLSLCILSLSVTLQAWNLTQQNLMGPPATCLPLSSSFSCCLAQSVCQCGWRDLQGHVCSCKRNSGQSVCFSIACTHLQRYYCECIHGPGSPQVTSTTFSLLLGIHRAGKQS